MAAKTPQGYFSEVEASRHLGVTVEEFRELLKRHIVEREEDLHNVSTTTFHASDLLLLKLMLGKPTSIAV